MKALTESNSSTPLQYDHPEVFTDITVGSIPGCNTTGFVTATGWDPVSGLGYVSRLRTWQNISPPENANIRQVPLFSPSLSMFYSESEAPGLYTM